MSQKPAHSNLDKGTLVHASCPVIVGSAVLVFGSSGSGKTALSLTLTRRARQAGLDATLLADDHTILDSASGDLIARCPQQIAGLVEVRPYGVVKHGLPLLDAAPVRLVVTLEDDPSAIERVQTGDTQDIEGVTLPALKLQRHPSQSDAHAVFAALGLPCWY